MDYSSIVDYLEESLSRPLIIGPELKLNVHGVETTVQFLVT